MEGGSTGTRRVARGEEAAPTGATTCAAESRADSRTAAWIAPSPLTGAGGSAGSNVAPHIPQNRFVPGFSFPHRLQRNRTLLAYSLRHSGNWMHGCKSWGRVLNDVLQVIRGLLWLQRICFQSMFLALDQVVQFMHQLHKPMVVFFPLRSADTAAHAFVRVLRPENRESSQSQHVSPLIASAPSFAIRGTMMRAAAGSAHHHPKAALRTSPNNRIADK